EIGVGGNNPNIERIDAQDFGNYVGKNRIRTLADIYRPAHDAHAALSIQSDMPSGMRHVVPVDRQPGSADVRAAGNPDALAVRQLLEFVLPIRSLDRLVDAQT